MKKRKVQAVIFYNASSNRKQFLLLKMNERRKFLWQNVTGKVEKGEKYTQAALRESQEETGLKNKNIKAIYKSAMKYTFIDQWEKNVKEKIFFLECHDKWDVEIDPSEHCEYKWVDEKDINRDSVHFDSNYRALLAAKELAN